MIIPSPFLFWLLDFPFIIPHSISPLLISAERKFHPLMDNFGNNFVMVHWSFFLWGLWGLYPCHHWEEKLYIIWLSTVYFLLGEKCMFAFSSFTEWCRLCNPFFSMFAFKISKIISSIIMVYTKIDFWTYQKFAVG